MPDLELSTPAHHKVLLAKHSMPGLVLGTVMLWFSLGSSLLPRAAMMQGVVSALSFVWRVPVVSRQVDRKMVWQIVHL